LPFSGGIVPDLSIFADESGDFGDVGGSDYYVLVLVLHDQSRDITAALDRLNAELRLAGLNPDHAIHSGAAIRGEDEYRGEPVEQRLREFTRLFTFAQKIPATYQSFRFRKREHPDRLRLKGAISRSLSVFLRDNAAYFLGFDRVTVYYDNGQAEITDVLNTLLNAFFFDVDFRRVSPASYRLFQVADLYATLELLQAKSEDHRLSRSDLYFFESRRALHKDYLSKLRKVRFQPSQTRAADA
jgi:hypothetical protein